MSPCSSPSKTHSPKGKTRVLDFLRNLLADESKKDLIIWTDKDNGEFRMVKPHRVAEEWGKETGNSDMNYDKMSRGLRHYKKTILEKVKGKDSRYRFLTGRSSSSPSSSTSSSSSSPPQFRPNFQLPMLNFGFPTAMITPHNIQNLTRGLQMPSTSSGPVKNTFNMSRFLDSESSGDSNSLSHSSPSSSSSSPLPSESTTSSGLPVQNMNFLMELYFRMYMANLKLIPK